ncbi:uncharacterized protein An08g11880 [Aspergillus niger]|uniref:Contig An08c0310, genomic contig n=2 Tax=Aspergillus niger TaxID=5061 RepID=A2QST6_ASPNC|nr:uncharacterized protein An08g11880 [Aspergillus niger]CAL00807.1 unnamed protein product [Aspergillus niger]
MDGSRRMPTMTVHTASLNWKTAYGPIEDVLMSMSATDSAI